MSLKALAIRLLESLADVLVTNPQNGQALVYENGYWVNQFVSAQATFPATTYNTTVVNIPASTGVSVALINGSAATTVNLPATPDANQIIIVQDYAMNAATYNITVEGNGNNINIPTGAESSYVIAQNGMDAWFNWNGAAWGILG